MGSPPVQTPITIIKAGDVGGFSLECVKALADCGYEPDDIGSYQAVKERVKDAQARRAQYVNDCKAAGKPADPHGPDPHTAMLAQCDVGHLSRNAWFRTADQKNHACGNRAPPDGEAGGYHNFAAPAFPAVKFDQATGKVDTSSPAEIATRVESAEAAKAKAANEAAIAGGTAAPGTQPNTLSPTQLSTISQRATSVAIGKTPGPSPTSPAHQAVMTASAAAVKPNVGALAAPQTAAGGTLTGSTAEECIEAFRKAAMEEMRNRIVAAHSPPELANTQAAAQARLDAANNRATAAAAATPPDPAEVNAAKRDQQTAQNHIKATNCYAQQAARLGTSRPPFVGVQN